MAAITTLNDPLTKSVILHVFNKFKADVLGADGQMKPSKQKFRLTSSTLAQQYSLKVEPSFLKARKVRDNVRDRAAPLSCLHCVRVRSPSLVALARFASSLCRTNSWPP